MPITETDVLVFIRKWMTENGYRWDIYDTIEDLLGKLESQANSRGASDYAQSEY